MTGVVAAGVVASATLLAFPVAADEGPPDLAALKAATARYHSVKVALADGYVPVGGCVPGMGYHYVNFARFGAAEPLRPEGLLYTTDKHGRLTLAGAEWFVVDEDQVVTTHNTVVPQMFGQTFDGPMPGHEAGMPVHYDLHAYVWAENPDGLFATWNTTITCP